MNSASDVLRKFASQRVLVMGDVMLDKYIFSEISRISPEAPVPVAHVKREQYYVGGAANVAANVTALGGKCFLIGLIGEDGAGRTFSDRCLDLGIETGGLHYHAGPTIQKIRVIGSNQQLLRLDYEEKITNPKEEQILNYIERIGSETDLVVVSDYNKGFVTPHLVAGLKKLNKKILVDAKPDNFDYYAGSYLIKLNRTEAESITGLRENGEASVLEIGGRLLEKAGSHILYTRGQDGMSLFELDGTVTHIPSQAKEVYDVTGAGDTCMATLAVALASGAPLREASILANHAVGLKVGKMGTQPVTSKELAALFEKEKSKIKTWEELDSILARQRSIGKEIVFTNGCFDILRIGHTTFLKQARALGDVLVLGLNTDGAVRRLKGPTRPLISQNERAEILAALESVDYVVFFNQDTPRELIELVKPDVLVKGGNYRIEEIVGHDLVYARGGRVHSLPLVDGASDEGGL